MLCAVFFPWPNFHYIDQSCAKYTIRYTVYCIHLKCDTNGEILFGLEKKETKMVKDIVCSNYATLDNTVINKAFQGSFKNILSLAYFLFVWPLIFAPPFVVLAAFLSYFLVLFTKLRSDPCPASYYRLLFYLPLRHLFALLLSLTPRSVSPIFSHYFSLNFHTLFFSFANFQ